MRLSNWFVPAMIAVFAVLSTPATVSAEFSDDSLDFDVLGPENEHHSGSNPNVSRLFFMPTFETLAQGQATIGTVDFLSAHGSFSPLDVVQVGGAIGLPGLAMAGAKVKLWRSGDSHYGIAAGINYTALNWGLGNDHDALTTGYLVGGYASELGQLHSGVFVMETRSESHVNFVPFPDPDYSNRHVKKERHVFGALGFSAPIQGNHDAMLELWGIGVNDLWPVVLPGFRFFEGNTSVQLVLLPLWYEDDELHISFPMIDITHHFP